MEDKKCLICFLSKPIGDFGRQAKRHYCDECKGKIENEVGLIKYYLRQIKLKWQKIK